GCRHEQQIRCGMVDRNNRAPDGEAPQTATGAITDPASNRRSYFRVTDRVSLEVQPLSGDKPDVASFFELSAQYQLISEFQLLDSESQALLRGITESDRRLGAYLKLLNRKLDSLCRTLALVNDPIDPASLQDVSLSEGGLSFCSPTNYPVDARLQMKMILLPSFCGLLLTGRVLSSQADGGAHQLHLEFVDLDDSQRQLLARHILRKQQEARRHRLEGD